MYVCARTCTARGAANAQSDRHFTLDRLILKPLERCTGHYVEDVSDITSGKSTPSPTKSHSGAQLLSLAVLNTRSHNSRYNLELRAPDRGRCMAMSLIDQGE